MRLLGGLAGTLMAMLTLAWAVQGDSFFLRPTFDRTASWVRRAMSRERTDAPLEAPSPETAPRDASALPPPVAGPIDRTATRPNAGPRGRAAPAPAAPPASTVVVLDAPAASPGASPLQPRTDGRERIITVTRRGPIVEQPGRSGPPLLVVDAGTGLKLLGIEGEWFKVEFTDRKQGVARVGYIQVQYVRAIPKR